MYNTLIPMVVFYNYSKDISKPFDYGVYDTSWLWYLLFILPSRYQWRITGLIGRILTHYFDKTYVTSYTPQWVKEMSNKGR